LHIAVLTHNKSNQEAHGQKDHSVAYVSGAEEITSAEEKIETLRQELREAEVAASAQSKAGIICNVVSSVSLLKSVMGPTVISNVEVNEVPTEALIDTGSPATIISLDFAMDVMAKKKPNYKTVEEWIAAIQKFEAP